MAPSKVDFLEVKVSGTTATLTWTNPDVGKENISHTVIIENLTNGGKSEIKLEKDKQEIKNLISGNTYTFLIQSKESGGSTVSSATITREVKGGDNSSKSFSQSGWITSVIAILVGIGNIIAIGYFKLDDQGNPELAISSVAIITFFGVLFISAHHNHTKAEDQRKHATGTMRRAMAASIILVYIITFSMTTFGDFQDKTIETTENEITEEIKNAVTAALADSENTEESITTAVTKVLDDKLPELEKDFESVLQAKTTLLGHFTTVASMVVIFYFGSKAMENWFGKKNHLDKKLVKNSLDEINGKLSGTSGGVPDAKESLKKLSETLS